LDDIINGHPQFSKIEALLLMDDDFMITFRNPDGTDGNCGRPNTFCQKMENVIKMNTMFSIVIKLQAPDVIFLGLRPRDYLATASRFNTSTSPVTPGRPVLVPESTPPPAAPNKLDNIQLLVLKIQHKFCPSPHQDTIRSMLV
jgi:hypothetical protein